MRKYKQVKRKEVIFSIDEWKLIEERAAAVLIKTGEFIRHISLTGHVAYKNTLTALAEQTSDFAKCNNVAVVTKSYN